MTRFSEQNIEEMINILLKGGDHRTQVINTINAEFFDFAIGFFKQIVEAKMAQTDITLDWYRKRFINVESKEDIAIYAGLNTKTIANIHGTTQKEVVIKVANENLDYLDSLLSLLEDNDLKDWNLTLKLEYHKVMVELSLKESLVVINALATKKIALRGGVWSSLGKTLEKPLMLKLCNLAGVPKEFIESHFIQDKNKSYDREVDFYLFNHNKIKKYRVEVQLMGKGNPESADAIFARDTDIFIADTLSEQNRQQLLANHIAYLELKDNQHIVEGFKDVLTQLDIPCGI